MVEKGSIFKNLILGKVGYVRTYCGLDTEDKETELKRLVRYQTAN